MPLSLLQRVGALVGRILFLLPLRLCDTTLKNISACFPNLKVSETRKLALSSVQQTTMAAFEMGKCWLWPIARTTTLVTRCKGWEIFESAMAGKNGVIILAPHLGNWELFAAYMAESAPITFMYQPHKVQSLDNLVKSARTRGQMRLAPANRNGVALLLRTLKAGDCIGILPDQEPDRESGEFAEFFGVPALTMTLVAGLVQRTGAEVICGYAKRLPAGGGFEVIFSEVDARVYDADRQVSVQGLNNTVESCVIDALDQYQWEYKRFKRRPDGSHFYH